MPDTNDAYYRAVGTRDTRLDGRIFSAVKTTGIYCRPSCPARTPKRENVVFFRTAAGAQAAGFRACRRCRPDVSPGNPDWNQRAISWLARSGSLATASRMSTASRASPVGFAPANGISIDR